MKMGDVLAPAAHSQSASERGREGERERGREGEREREGAPVPALLLLESGASCSNGRRRCFYNNVEGESSPVRLRG